MEKIQAILFYRAGPVTKKELKELLSIDDTGLASAFTEIKDSLPSSIFEIIETDTSLQLVLKAEFDPIIEELKKADLKRDIGKAGAETLAIITYNEPISRPEIDKIRGVNSSYILRSLETRGLIERSAQKGSDRYTITPALLRHLGITHKSEMPGYVDTVSALEIFEKNQEK